MRGLVLAAVAGLALAAGEARADTTLKLAEVITSPQRTEILKGLIAKFEQANPGRQGRDDLAALGPGLREVRHHGPGRRHARRGRDAGPLAGALRQRWQLENLEPWIAKWDDARKLTSDALQIGSLRQEHAYMMPYGFYLRAMFCNKKLFQEAGLDRAAGDDGRVRRGLEEDLGQRPGKYGYCLRGGPGGLNGWIMFMRTPDGHNELLQPGRHLDPQPARAGQGPADPGRHLQERATRRRTA